MQPFTNQEGRRSFLKAAVGVMAAPTLLGGQTPTPTDGFVDAHSHVWTSDVAKYPIEGNRPASILAPLTFTAEELLKLANANGVSRVVLIQHKPYFGVDNRYLADAMAAYPGVFSAVACINAEAPRPGIEMQRLKALGFRGFRIREGEGAADRWIHSPGMCEMWACAAEQNLVMCPLIGAENLPQVDEMCSRFPKTTVVIDHLARIGSTGDFPEADVQKLLGLVKHPNVNVKVSAFYYLGKKTPPYRDLVPLIRRVRDAFGCDRLMWGSDSPYQVTWGMNNYPASLELIQKGLDFLSDAERTALLKTTATRVFFSS